MPRIERPSSGWQPLDEAAQSLGMQRSQFYSSGLADWLDYYQDSEKSRRMYRVSQIDQMRYWLDIRRGQIELGMISPKSSILPPPYDGDLAAFVEADEYGAECPECGGFAVEVEHRIYCEKCGIV